MVEIPEHLLPDPSLLELLADVLDRQDDLVGENDREVQGDLRTWASNLREFGVDGRFERTNR